MKQKRKVKSLVFNKQYKVSNTFTVMLCILWWVLCRWAISLLFLNRPTLAAWDEWEDDVTIKYLQYVSSVEDKAEVLDRLSFSLTWEDGQDTIVTEMYQEGPSLYVIPKPLVVNSYPALGTRNLVNTGVWGNILWWNHNSVDSDNITIIWWENNTVESGNINSTILWWMENILSTWNESPSIMIGWKQNTILGNKGVNLVIWWLGNTVSDTENVNIVWWLGNTVTNWSNVIVWWSRVTVWNGVRNVFVFSDGETDFNLSNPSDENDTFYLQVSNGLWLNIKWSKWWVESRWAVSFGKIDITDTAKKCLYENLWVQWMWEMEYQWKTYGCLVWCTKKSSENGLSWELMDTWEACTEKCKETSQCMTPEDTEEEYYYDAFCTTWVISTKYAVMCSELDLQKYKNAIFETALIDSETVCPNGENKCVYQCASWYHLTWDVTGRRGTINGVNKVWCYQDCEWYGTTKRHNEIITWYNMDIVSCSVENTNFPEDKATNHDNCGNHKASLICSDGVWYMWDNVRKKTWATANNSGYTYESCELTNFVCNTGDYNLTQSDINLFDNVDWTKDVDGKHNLNLNWGTNVNWQEWVYKVCVDYNPEEPHNGEQCNDIAHHYHWVKCQPGYRTWDHHDQPWECRKERTLTYDYTTNKWLSTQTFSFNNNGLGTLPTKNVFTGITSGAEISLAPTVIKKDTKDNREWEFIWWNTDKDAHEWLPWTTYLMPDGDLRLYAIYKKVLTGTFHTNGTGINIIGSTVWSCVLWNRDTSCTFTWAYNFTRGDWWIVDGWNTNKNSCPAVTYGTWLTGYKISWDTDFYTITHKYWEATFMPNGASGGVETRECKICNTQNSCNLSNVPGINRWCWDILWWSTNSGATAASVTVTWKPTLGWDTVYYAITSRSMKGTFDANLWLGQNQYWLRSSVWSVVWCKIYNTQTGCAKSLPQITTLTPYYPIWWTLYSWAIRNNGDIYPGEFNFTFEDDNDTFCPNPKEYKFYAQVGNGCNKTLKLTFDYTTNGWNGFSWTVDVPTNVLTGLYPNQSVNLKWNSPMKAPGALKNWWEFVWWNTNKDAQSGLSSIYMDTCGDKVVYAIYKKTCTVYFDANGSEVSYSNNSCTVWNTHTGCNITPAVIIPQTATSTTVAHYTIWFSRSKTGYNNEWNDTPHRIDLTGNSSGFNCGSRWYAQTESNDVTHNLVLKKNGNYCIQNGTRCATGDLKLLCNCTPTYNWEVQSKYCPCTVTWRMPNIKAVESDTVDAKWEKLWWTDTIKYGERHQLYKIWVRETRMLTGDYVLYAQTRRTFTLTFQNYNCNSALPTTTTGCTIWNGNPQPEKCAIDDINSPAITGYPLNQVPEWSTSTAIRENIWSPKIWKSLMMTGNITYYARCRDRENGACELRERYGCESGIATGKQMTQTWYEWRCEWLDGISNTCSYVCGENEYPTEDWCKEFSCHHCAKDGFPYCFPVDFSPTCKEIDFIGNWEFANGGELVREYECRINPDYIPCETLFGSSSAVIKNTYLNQTACESQTDYTACCDRENVNCKDCKKGGGSYRVSCTKWVKV